VYQLCYKCLVGKKWHAIAMFLREAPHFVQAKSWNSFMAIYAVQFQQQPQPAASGLYEANGSKWFLTASYIVHDKT
jgi:hypothetical protein